MQKGRRAMAYISARLHSELLQHGTEVDLYFPNDYPKEVVPEIRGVITLLHGYGGTSKDWLQLSAACRYAADNGLIIVAPECSNGFYCDMAYGDAWYTYLTQELPGLLQKIFRIPQEKEKNFIAGLSMGGYGAMMIGMNHPERYAGIASFSGAVDVAQMLKAGSDVPGRNSAFVPIFGDETILKDNQNLYKLSEKVSELSATDQPKLLFTCGSDDTEPYFILPQNRSLHEYMKKLPLKNYRYMEWPGNHEWKFWDRSLVYAIDWFLSPGYAQNKLDDWRSEPQIYN